MGEIAKKLHQRLASKAHTLPTTEPKRKPGELLPGGIKPLETLIQEGHDPFHATYVFMQNMTAHFAERCFKSRDLTNRNGFTTCSSMDWGRTIGTNSSSSRITITKRMPSS
jgi:hypothetical protein